MQFLQKIVPVPQPRIRRLRRSLKTLQYILDSLWQLLVWKLLPVAGLDGAHGRLDRDGSLCIGEPHGAVVISNKAIGVRNVRVRRM